MRYLISICICLLLVAPCMAETINVDANGSADFNNIQAAINAAFDGDTVLVADGTYTGDGNRDIDFLGKAITVRSENGPQNCIIDCNGTGTDPHRGFHFISGEDANSVLDGFTITNGYADAGGGILCYQTSPTITNCSISRNSAGYGYGYYGYYSYGGGICCWETSPTITNCTISGNSSDLGGGIYCRDSNPAITNCTISGNSAQYRGGGVYCSGEGATITNCILWDNTDSEIYGSPIVTYSDIKGGFPGEGNIDQDPCFALTTDYHLMPGSPGIDAGTNEPCDGLPTTDKDGAPRPLDGDGDGNDVADMGAYEYSLHSPSIAVSAVSFYFVQDWPKKPDPQTLQIRNCGGQPLQWEIVEDCSWLKVAPANGVSTDQINEVTITVDPNGLTPALYTCTFKVQDLNASNSPVTVRVLLRVGALLRVPQHFLTIQAAIDAADDYDLVLVADGNYTGPGNRDIDFKGKAITVRSESGPENCIIDCNYTGRGFYFQNGESENSVVEGFTITDARGSRGGGIYCDGKGGACSPTITNCTIKGNRSGIYCRDSNPTITNCTISENGIGYGPGGGIFCEASSPTITNCTIRGNNAWRRPPGGGGGIYCYNNSSPTITNCTITGNRGGIASMWGSSPIIKNCTISGNRDEGIYCRDSSPTITNCIITGNWGEYDRGGGIYCNAGSLLIITNCTIAKNQGRGVYCSGEGATITNCILWDNTDSEIYGSPIVTYSDIKGGFPGEGNINADPCFVEPGYLDDNGTPEDIWDDFWVEGEYHLLRTSPCVDAGTDANVYTDIEGSIRPFDFPGVDNNGDLPEFDMGAYELAPFEAEMVLTPQTLNCKSKGNWVKAHFVLPEGFYPEDVDVNEPAIAEPMGIESEYIKVLGAGTGLVRLEICFDREAFCDSVTETGEVEITVIGPLTTSRYFYATDIIKIKPRR